jgi:alpha-L-fucosidase
MKQSIRQHVAPEWFHDAKFGIFIHWRPFSIPAFAPTGHGNINTILRNEGPTSFFTNIPYSEWYVNSMRIPGSPVAQFHSQHYGCDFPYANFAVQFRKTSRAWDPVSWADLFQIAGARYVVLVTKHMDGFLMWPSRTPNYRLPNYHMTRDIAGELTTAVRAHGLRMGFYYSSALDQSFTDGPMVDFAGLLSEGGPIDSRYAAYQFGHWQELIDRYAPSILWGDIAYPPGTNLYALFAYFYNKIEEGVVNDRWGQLPYALHRLVRMRPGRRLLNWLTMRLVHKYGAVAPKPPHSDFVTPEFTSFSDIRSGKWETCRGMAGGFGYNRMERDEDYLTLPALIHLLVDIVSKNGNLLLNVGPMATGEIPPVQINLLSGLGAWLAVYGEAIYATRPWTHAEGSMSGGRGVRFTRKGDTVYAIVLDAPQERSLTINGVQEKAIRCVRDLADGHAVHFRQEGDAVTLDLPAPLAADPAHVFALE